MRICDFMVFMNKMLQKGYINEDDKIGMINEKGQVIYLDRIQTSKAKLDHKQINGKSGSILFWSEDND